MIIAKVTVSNRDEILGAILRALAVQSAGFQTVGGMNKQYLQDHGYYRFRFHTDQFDRFKALVKSYIPDRFQQTVEITAENPN
jgi:hypothetical protein